MTIGLPIPIPLRDDTRLDYNDNIRQILYKKIRKFAQFHNLTNHLWPSDKNSHFCLLGNITYIRMIFDSSFSSIFRKLICQHLLLFKKMQTLSIVKALLKQFWLKYFWRVLGGLWMESSGLCQWMLWMCGTFSVLVLWKFGWQYWNRSPLQWILDELQNYWPVAGSIHALLCMQRWIVSVQRSQMFYQSNSHICI